MTTDAMKCSDIPDFITLPRVGGALLAHVLSVLARTCNPTIPTSDYHSSSLDTRTMPE